jgi:CheY-like chemotaxis protein
MANILLVDDDPVLLKLYSTRLAADGHQVQTAIHGQAALELLAQFSPQVIILDLLMPRLNGYKFLEAIAQNPRFQQTVRIVFSSVASGDQAARLKALGVSQFLNKSETTPTQLVEVINRYLPKTPG